MAADISNKLVIAISSRALFNLDASNKIYETEGEQAYALHQIAHENEILQPGVAFPLIEKLLQLNQKEELVEVILLSRNSANTGLRVFNSIQHYQLDISRAVFTSGKSPYHYIEPFKTHLFLSANVLDVKAALTAGYAAALILPFAKTAQKEEKELKIAFDGDSVIFSNESEMIFKHQGLDAFTENEILLANQPLAGGPFKGFLAALHHIQQCFPDQHCPIRTALVTARQAPAHKRVIHTLRSWNIRIDEAFFLGGLEKGKFLQAFGADIFFDDQSIHCQSAQHYVATGHVPLED